MKARFFLSPLDAPLHEFTIREPTRMSDLFTLPERGPLEAVDTVEVMEWFADGGCVQINGHLIPPDRWASVTLRPHPAAEVVFIYVPQGKKSFALLATVALIALTTAISGGLAAPFLGAGFAAGTFGATALAAGVSLAGSLAISALTAPPKVSNQGEQRELSQAGVSGNTISLLEVLPAIVGKIGASPPYLAPPYTVWDGDNVTAYAVVGVQGRCLVENVKVNGLPITDYAGATYETREGYAGDAARTLFTETVIEERDGITLKNFITDLEASKNDTLKDQITPANSSPDWHPFHTAGEFTEVVFRFLFPSGIVDVANNRSGIVPLRIQARKKGEATWRKFPTIHFQDVRKGGGPMRAEVRVVRGNPPDGRHPVWGDQEFPVCSIRNSTGYNKAWAYTADNYFGTNVERDFYGLVGGALSSNSSASPYVISASSENGSGTAAWKTLDATNSSSYWQPAGSGINAWLKWDFGSAITLNSYELGFNYSSFVATPDTAPTQWTLEGSNDDSNWTLIHNIDDTEFDGRPTGHFCIGNPSSYRYYRWTFTAIKSGTTLRVAHLVPRTDKCFGSFFNMDPSASQPAGQAVQESRTGNWVTCQDCLITEKGCDIYLRNADWDDGEYEFRIMRGWAAEFASFESGATYELSGSENNTYYFDAQLSGSPAKYKIFRGQKDYRSDMTVEAFQTIDANEAPFVGTDVALVAVAIPNIQISSIYAEFTRYAAEWDGTIWSATEVPTQNPAALYRQILLGGANGMPVPGEAIDEDGLASWYETCEANGYEANAILQGARVAEAKQLIATAGYASPRDADTYGVVEDKDTSSEPLRYVFSDLNASELRVTQELPVLPDAIRAEFSDEAQGYAVEHRTVYRDGADASTARRFDVISYPGFTDGTKVEARALFDLRQAYLRQVRYSLLAGDDAIMLQRGSLVGLSTEIVTGQTAQGWITEIEVSGGDVVSITLDNIMPWSGSGDVEAIEDISSITDIVDPSQPMGIAIRIPGAEILRKQVSDISDSNVCTLATPFPYVGSGLDTVDLEKEGVMVIAGAWGTEVLRCKVMAVVPQPDMKRRLILADEAPGLFS